MQAITTEGKVEIGVGQHRGFIILEFARIWLAEDYDGDGVTHLAVDRVYRAVRMKNWTETWPHLRAVTVQEIKDAIDQQLHEVRNPLPF